MGNASWVWYSLRWPARPCREASTKSWSWITTHRSTGLLALATQDSRRPRQRRRGVAFQCVPEPRQGLLFGRISGVRAAAAPLVCFLDDDNVPEADYLEQGIHAFLQQNLGILVSRVFPHYVSRRPSASISRRENLLATGPLSALGVEGGEFRCRADPRPRRSAGCGSVVRRSLPRYRWTTRTSC